MVPGFYHLPGTAQAFDRYRDEIRLKKMIERVRGFNAGGIADLMDKLDA